MQGAAKDKGKNDCAESNTTMKGLGRGEASDNGEAMSGEFAHGAGVIRRWCNLRERVA